MRVQDRAKMDPTNALFLSVKIIRIHCKKQGLGRTPCNMFCDIFRSFCCFAKNVLFHNLSFCLNESSISEVFRSIFSVFWGHFLSIYVLFKKNVFFHNLSFCLNGSSISEVFRSFCFSICWSFFWCFFGPRFSVKKRKSLKFIAKNMVF